MPRNDNSERPEEERIIRHLDPQRREKGGKVK